MAAMKKPAPLEYKPDLEEAARRWEAYWAGEIVDRPVVCVTSYWPDRKGRPGSSYRDRVYGDMDQVIETALLNAWATYHAGESIPGTSLSFGPDEVAVFCGAELEFAEGSPDTNWSRPFVEDWNAALPLRMNEDHPLWRRMLEFYRRAVRKTAGKMLLGPIDLHTNMDILAPIRNPERLCMDLLDCPDLIDRAMADARAIFPIVWYGVAQAAEMDRYGYSYGGYSMEGSATLQCDFSCMMSPDMFRRWVMPALEEEAAIVKHACYHWDGPVRSNTSTRSASPRACTRWATCPRAAPTPKTASCISATWTCSRNASAVARRCSSAAHPMSARPPTRNSTRERSRTALTPTRPNRRMSYWRGS